MLINSIDVSALSTAKPVVYDRLCDFKNKLETTNVVSKGDILSIEAFIGMPIYTKDNQFGYNNYSTYPTAIGVPYTLDITNIAISICENSKNIKNITANDVIVKIYECIRALTTLKYIIKKVQKYDIDNIKKLSNASKVWREDKLINVLTDISLSSVMFDMYYRSPRNLLLSISDEYTFDKLYKFGTELDTHALLDNNILLNILANGDKEFNVIDSTIIPKQLTLSDIIDIIKYSYTIEHKIEELIAMLNMQMRYNVEYTYMDSKQEYNKYTKLLETVSDKIAIGFLNILSEFNQLAKT